MAHSQRPEDPLRGKGPQGFARGSPHDHRQEKEAAVAVEVLGAGLEVRCPLAGEDRQGVAVSRYRLFLNPAPAQQVEVVPEAAGMVQQMPDGDGPGVAGNLREVLLNLIVQRQLAVLGQEHHRKRGELLGHRADIEDGGGSNGELELDARETIALGVREPAVPHHPERTARGTRGGEAAEDRVDPSRGCGIGRLGFEASQPAESREQAGRRTAEEWRHPAGGRLKRKEAPGSFPTYSRLPPWLMATARAIGSPRPDSSEVTRCRLER